MTELWEENNQLLWVVNSNMIVATLTHQLKIITDGASTILCV